MIKKYFKLSFGYFRQLIIKNRTIIMGKDINEPAGTTKAGLKAKAEDLFKTTASRDSKTTTRSTDQSAGTTKAG